jgi:hypothetical protein
MQTSKEDALIEASSRILDTSTFVRAVLSGRRRNMQVEYERIDIRLVEIKGILNLQLMKMMDEQRQQRIFCHNRSQSISY